jgi:hypothetical protein
VNTANNTAFCFGGCGFTGSVIDYYQKRHNAPDALAAAQALAAQAGLREPQPNDGNGNPHPPAPSRTGRKRIPPPPGVNVHTEPPPADWQARALAALVDVLCPALWTPEGARARAWLMARGIDEKACARYGLGYTLGGEVNGIQFAKGRGVVIPHYYHQDGPVVRRSTEVSLSNLTSRLRLTNVRDETVYALRVRRAVAPGAPDKYYCATGSKPGASLFNADSLVGRDVREPQPRREVRQAHLGRTSNDLCFVVEGELDAICLHSQIADLAAVISLGSKNARIADYWLPHLLHVKRFYIATDANEDEAAAGYWLSLVGSRGVRVKPPGGCKDVCEAAGKNFDLRQWTLEIINQ